MGAAQAAQVQTTSSSCVVRPAYRHRQAQAHVRARLLLERTDVTRCCKLLIAVKRACALPACHVCVRTLTWQLPAAEPHLLCTWWIQAYAPGRRIYAPGSDTFDNAADCSCGGLLALRGRWARWRCVCPAPDVLAAGRSCGSEGRAWAVGPAGAAPVLCLDAHICTRRHKSAAYVEAVHGKGHGASRCCTCSWPGCTCAHLEADTRNIASWLLIWRPHAGPVHWGQLMLHLFWAWMRTPTPGRWYTHLATQPAGCSCGHHKQGWAVGPASWRCACRVPGCVHTHLTLMLGNGPAGALGPRTYIRTWTLTYVPNDTISWPLMRRPWAGPAQSG
jgi:hypothetical protein